MRNFILLCAMSGVLGFNISYAGCDPSRFSHHCKMPFVTTSTSDSPSVYCGVRLGHITQRQYALLKRYQRANWNMVLTLNGEYIDSPCVPIGH